MIANIKYFCDTDLFIAFLHAHKPQNIQLYKKMHQKALTRELGKIRGIKGTRGEIKEIKETSGNKGNQGDSGK